MTPVRLRPSPETPAPQGTARARASRRPLTPQTLGGFLRAARERIQPQDRGLSAAGRRRAKGLRREEVAALCGISTTWYTWIEQDRTTAVSAHTLGELARGLGLSAAERRYLFQLAGRADPQGAAVAEADLASHGMLVRSVRSPAYVLDRHWNAVAWNPPAADLLSDWLGPRTAARARRTAAPAPAPDLAAPNLLRYVFLHPHAPRLIVDWPERARRVVAEYRADSAAWSDDPAHARLVDELCAASPAFEAAWRSQQVLSREGGERRFRHPVKGEVSYVQFTMRMAQAGDVKLIVLHPCKDVAPRTR